MRKGASRKTTRSSARSATRAEGAKKRSTRGVGLAGLRSLALALPETQEGTSYGTPAFRVKGKLFARLLDDGESLAVKVDLEEREFVLQADPQTFYLTDHYRDYPMMLVRLPRIHVDDLRAVLEQAWRIAAPKRLAATLEARSS